jgi:hypothetical protein
MYLLEVGGADPWAYAHYHCGQLSNAYGNVHWGVGEEEVGVRVLDFVGDFWGGDYTPLDEALAPLVEEAWSPTSEKYRNQPKARSRTTRSGVPFGHGSSLAKFVRSRGGGTWRRSRARPHRFRLTGPIRRYPAAGGDPLAALVMKGSPVRVRASASIRALDSNEVRCALRARGCRQYRLTRTTASRCPADVVEVSGSGGRGRLETLTLLGYDLAERVDDERVKLGSGTGA